MLLQTSQFCPRRPPFTSKSDHDGVCHADRHMAEVGGWTTYRCSTLAIWRPISCVIGNRALPDLAVRALAFSQRWRAEIDQKRF
jgi:hypothetical protein